VSNRVAASISEGWPGVSGVTAGPSKHGGHMRVDLLHVKRLRQLELLFWLHSHAYGFVVLSLDAEGAPIDVIVGDTVAPKRLDLELLEGAPLRLAGDLRQVAVMVYSDLLHLSLANYNLAVFAVVAPLSVDDAEDGAR
jgi:hypothetical protein